MPIAIMRTPHNNADTRGYLVADNYAMQEVRPRYAGLLSRGKCRGNGCGARVIHCVPEAVIELCRVRRRAIDQRSGPWRGFFPQAQLGWAAIQIVGHGLRDRTSVVSGKRVYVRVDPGGRRTIKQKNTTQL